jgi:hypothetical protein
MPARRMSNLRRELVDRLEHPGVEHRPLPDRDDGFASLFCQGKAIEQLSEARLAIFSLSRVPW